MMVPQSYPATKVMQTLQDAALKFIEAMQPFIDAWVSVVQQIAPRVQALYNAIYDQYRAAGLPYGDSHDGFMRWIDDLSEIHKREAEIERIREQWEFAIWAREFGEQVRARRTLDKP